MAERLLDLELANTIPSEFAALVMACLAKEPQQRRKAPMPFCNGLKQPNTGRMKPLRFLSLPLN